MMTDENKKKLALLLEQRRDDCMKDVLSPGDTCRLECSLYRKCQILQVLFEVNEELNDDGIFITEEDRKNAVL